MKITIVLDNGTRHKARLPYEGAHHIELRIAKCPHGCGAICDALDATGAAMPPFIKVAGSGIKHTSRDTYFADAIALCCRRKIGTIETQVDTVFGIEEDERVLNGPWRVY